MLTSKRRAASTDSGWASVSDFLLVMVVMLVVSHRYVVDRLKPAIDDLRNALAAREQEIDDMSDAEQALRNTEKALKTRLAELVVDLENSDSRQEQLDRQITDLNARKNRLNEQVAELEAKQDQLNKQIGHLQSERGQLNKQIVALRSERDEVSELYKIAAHDLKTTNNALQLVRDEKALLSKKLTALTNERDLNLKQLAAAKAANKRLVLQADDLTRDNHSLADQLARRTKQVEKYEVILRRQNERLLKPLEAARLVVKIRSTTPLESHLDLDLYVQDPSDRVCYWKHPRVFTKLGEHATLIPSEHIRDVRAIESVVEGSAADELAGHELAATEVYFAQKPFRQDKPYLVFGMVRRKGATNGEEQEHKIEYEIIIKDEQRRVTQHLTNTVALSKVGAVSYSESGGETYPGLLPMIGFEVANDESTAIRLVPREQLPDLLRGWEKRVPGPGAVAVSKLFDTAQP